MLSLFGTHEMRRSSAEAIQKGISLGFVPTMGALHEGHASLIRRAKSECELVVVSIFVNPTQFGPNEDYQRYPRTPEADLKLAEAAGADWVFMPSADEMYPPGKKEIGFSVAGMDKIMEGASRPGHFNGVLMVVAKLFHLVQPSKAYFGMKDFQQLSLIRKMVAELFFPIGIVGCPTLRESDGLAMSSRNRYLNADERKDALFLSRALSLSKDLFILGLKPEEILNEVNALANSYPSIQTDYFEIREAEDLSLVSDAKLAKNPVALIAARCGTTRLIDNMSLFE